MKLVLLHALPLDSRQWSGQMDILPGETVAPTLYSFGDTIGAWAEGALDAAGEGPLIVVGNSVGGSCALEMARQAGNRIAAIVLVGAKAGHRCEDDFRDRFILELETDRSVMVRRWAAGLLGASVDERIRNDVYRMAEEQSLENLVRGVRVFHGRPDAGDVLSAWKKPLVFVRGEQDRQQVGQEHAEVVPNCGHYVNLENAAAFNAILTRVVESCLAR